MAINYNETMEQVEKYFEQCKSYWIRQHNDSPAIATAKALWWDCAECWNYDKSWNEAKVEFFNRYRIYKPYEEIPTEKAVEEGRA